ncbi:hypothetical protein [Paenibacillus tyrfis]|uniref:hypothetical protein n=1 Tax=Paenibacillus tyrfis TaxID=1501230 RepID=UPI00209F3BE3|nr:hypothetical protein [Paenibacillus tyrfis]MCP1307366.1 hypothetical protein [Paenibacillus tyrfis]
MPLATALLNIGLFRQNHTFYPKKFIFPLSLLTFFPNAPWHVVLLTYAFILPGTRHPIILHPPSTRLTYGYFINSLPVIFFLKTNTFY